MDPGFENKKKETVNKITGLLIEALEKETMTEDEAQPVARFILDEKEKVKDANGLVVFIQTLSSRWPLFKDLSTIETQSVQQGAQDQQKLDLIKDQLSKLANVTV